MNFSLHSADALYSIAISMIKGMTIDMVRQIEQHVGSLEEFFRIDERRLEALFSGKSRIYSRETRDAVLSAADNELKWMENSGVKALYFSDDAYPKRLLDCCDAPVVLYSYGAADLNVMHVVSVVGTRHATTYGMNFIHNFIADLAGKIPNLLLVSGLAYGVDVCAHRESMSAGLPTVGVLGHGLSMIYPPVHRQVASDMIGRGGGLVSDYPHNVPVYQFNFLARNRIIAGMSDAVIVVESAKKGGGLVTAEIASDYGRDVFAVPGRVTDIYSEGCNRLIMKNRASVVTSADDFIAAMNWTPNPVEGDQKELIVEFTPEQKQIIDYLVVNGEAQLNKLSVDIGMPVSKLIPLLGDMEFNEIIAGIPGGKYTLVKQLH